MRHPAIPYVAPFALYICLLAVGGFLPIGIGVHYPIRIVAVAVLLWFVSRPVLDWKPGNPIASVLLGTAVFLIWIGPDVLAPEYRQHWLLQNSISGRVESSVPVAIRNDLGFIIFRVIGCAVIVPIVEELFWRGWLARWLVNSEDFRRAPLGAYTASAFWIGSILFASEHGPFWDVGLLAGIAYNWWMIRTRNLADCILAHATTNGLLSIYVLATDNWVYWM